MSNKIIKELSNTRINEINKKMGTTDISKIADGTCTGAIKELSNQLIENGEGDNMGIADKVNAIYENLGLLKDGVIIIVKAVNSVSGSEVLNDESTPQDIADVITSLGSFDIDSLQPWVFISNSTFTVPIKGNYKITLKGTNGGNGLTQGYDISEGTYSSPETKTNGGAGYTFTGICQLSKGQILNMKSIGGTSSAGWSDRCDGHARKDNYQTRVCGGNGGTGGIITIDNQTLVSVRGGNGGDASNYCNGKSYHSAGGQGGGSSTCNNLAAANWLSGSHAQSSNGTWSVTIQYIGMKTS